MGSDLSLEEGVHVLCQRHPLGIPQLRVWFGFAVATAADFGSWVVFGKGGEDCFSGRSGKLQSGLLHCSIKDALESLPIGNYGLRQAIQQIEKRLLESKALGFLLSRRIAALP